MFISSQSRNTNSLFVAPLAYFEHKSLALAGGKGANLGELIKAGFNVPPGFVIITAAYDSMLGANGLQEQMQKKLAVIQVDDPAAVKEASQDIRDLILHASLPDSMANAFINAYRQLGSGAIVVRSSATAEDLPGAAFAGQQETILNVVGEQALLDAVRTCWASLWSERAILYRAHQNIDQASVKLAVVVQRMVQADVAGVMFTANPVSGTRDELVIDANPGLGEAVVSGLVTPDHFVVNKRSLRIKEQRVGRREVIIRSKAGGGTEQTTPTDQRGPTILSPAALRSLARLGCQIEKHYTAPQDIEWAWVMGGSKKGRFYILQARPMTALPKPVKITGPMRMVVPMLVEMWPTCPYPLDITTFTGAIERAIGNLLVVMIGRSAPDPDKALVEEDGVVVRFEPPEVHPSPSMLITPWLTLWRTRHYDPFQWQVKAIIPEVLASAHELEQRNPRSISWEQNLETLHAALALIPRVMDLRERYLPQTLLSAGILWALLAICGEKNHLGTLIIGAETKTTENNRALEALAMQIRRDAALHEIFAQNDSNVLVYRLESEKRHIWNLNRQTTAMRHRCWPHLWRNQVENKRGRHR